MLKKLCNVTPEVLSGTHGANATSVCSRTLSNPERDVLQQQQHTGCTTSETELYGKQAEKR